MLHYYKDIFFMMRAHTLYFLLLYFFVKTRCLDFFNVLTHAEVLFSLLVWRFCVQVIGDSNSIFWNW